MITLAKRRTQEEWFKLVQDFNNQSLSLDAYCDQQGISTTSFYKYKRQLKKNNTLFLPIVFEDQEPKYLRFECNGYKLEVDSKMPTDQLRKLMKAIQHDT